jgi:hypothetical protein
VKRLDLHGNVVASSLHGVLYKYTSQTAALKATFDTPKKQAARADIRR